MATKKDLEYYLAQARRIAEHREAGAEKEIRKLYKEMVKDLSAFVSEAYVKYAKDDKLTFAMLQEAGYNARFLEEIEQRINVATPKAAKELRRLVEETYKIAYEGMVDGVQKAGADGLDAAFADAVAITPEQIKAEWNPYVFDSPNEKFRVDPDKAKIHGGAFCLWCDKPSAETPEEILEHITPYLYAAGEVMNS